MNILSQRYSGKSDEYAQSRYKFTIISGNYCKTKEGFNNVQGHDFLYLRSLSI